MLAEISLSLLGIVVCLCITVCFLVSNKRQHAALAARQIRDIAAQGHQRSDEMARQQQAQEASLAMLNAETKSKLALASQAAEMPVIERMAKAMIDRRTEIPEQNIRAQLPPGVYDWMYRR